MKVILRKDVEHLGRAGEVKDVARGYARNYLLVRRLAMPATPEAVAWFEKGRQKRQALREKALGQARELCAKIAGVSLSFTRAASEQGQLFGSVGKSDIVKSLKASGYVVDKDDVVLDASIKSAGEYEVEIRLAPEASAKVKLSVLPRQA